MKYTKSKKFIYKLLAVFIAAMIVLPYNMVFAGPAQTNPEFDTGVPLGFDMDVYAIARQDDGKIIVGGLFTTYKGVSANRIIRLNSDGSKDSSFDIGTGFDQGVNSIVIQDDGEIIVGGLFTTYKGVSANRIIRLNSDGSKDSSFDIGTGFDQGVNSIVIQDDGEIIVGGLFTTYKGVSANRIIRLNSDGSRDSSFDIGTGFNQGVNSMKVQSIAIQNDGKIVIGGNFYNYQGVSANRIIRLNSDGSRDSSFDIGTGFNQGVNSITVQSIAIQDDGKIVMGGNFYNYQGVSANRIIRLNSDGSRDSSFDIGNGFNQEVNSIAIQDDGKIIIGGSFSDYQGVSANRIIRLNSDGSKDSSFDIGSGFSGLGNSTVRSIVLQNDGKIILGGDFTSYKGVSANKIIKLNSDGSRDSSLNLGNGFDQRVYSIVIQDDGKILVGGNFTTYKGVSANRIIRLNSDGSIDSSFDIGTGFDNRVLSIVIQDDGKILVGGGFTNYKGVAANRIIRLNSDGSIDSSFDIGAGFDQSVSSIAIQDDGKILVGGYFYSYKGVGANSIIRLNSDGSRDSSFDIGNGFGRGVNSIVIQDDGKILVGGPFASYKGVETNCIIRLNSDGSKDSSFDIGAGYFNGFYYPGEVASLAIQDDGKIVVGGNFYNYKGVNANNIIRLNSDGSSDSSFDIGNGFNARVISIAIQDDGKIVVGGYFDSYKGVSANSIIRLNSDGSRDSSFDIGNGFNSYVNSVAIQDDEKIVVGGEFSSYQGIPSPYIISLFGDSDTVIIPNTSNTTTINSEFTSKGYTQSNGDLVGSKPISLSLTEGNIPNNLSIKNSNIKLIIPQNVQFKKSDNVTNYDGIILPPTSRSISTVQDETVLSAFKVGSSSESIKLDGGVATLMAPAPGKNVGDTVNIYYTNNIAGGRYPHSTATVIDYNGQPYAQFTTDHFTDFAITLPPEQGGGEFNGSFVINNDAASTSSTSVTLNMTTNPTASQMRFANDSPTGWSSREAYSNSKSWTLSAGTGSKTVYVQFDTNDDNISDAQTSDTINYTDGSSGGSCIGGEGIACLNLEISAVDGYCQYGKNLDLGQRDQSYSAFIMSGDFLNLSGSDSRYCDDRAGKSPWTLDISASNLVTSGDNVFTIPNTAIEMFVATPQKYLGSTSFTFGNGDFANQWANLATTKTVFEKTSDAGSVGKLGTDSVDLRVNVPANQAIGAYQSTITIQVPVMTI